MYSQIQKKVGNKIMKILAIDTSSKICGVCLLEDDKELFKKNIETDRSHSIKLMPFIEEVFQNVDFELKDVDLIVCDKGPGSFTGIRIGVATAKAFADSLNKNIIGVNSLETLSYRVGYASEQPTFICPILDARNDNCYIALYQFNNGKCAEIVAPFSDNIDSALTSIKAHIVNLAQPNIVFVGDGSKNFEDKILSVFANSKIASNDCDELDAYYLGLAGYKKYLEGNLESCLPLYLKKPQAQQLRR